VFSSTGSLLRVVEFVNVAFIISSTTVLFDSSDVVELSGTIISLSVNPQDAKKVITNKITSMEKNIRMFFTGKHILS